MKCSYCTDDVKKGRGIMFVYNTGIVKYYCSSRCYKNDVSLKRTFNKKEKRNRNLQKKS